MMTEGGLTCDLSLQVMTEDGLTCDLSPQVMTESGLAKSCKVIFSTGNDKRWPDVSGDLIA